MSMKRSLTLCRRAVRHRTPKARLSTPRSYATKSNSNGDAGIIQQTIATPAGLAIQSIGRFFLFSAIGIVAFGATGAIAFEGTHQYVENWAMEPETDEEVKKFEWDLSEGSWRGDPHAGGTDPGLGFYARHSLRAAWIAQYWGIGPPELYAPVVQGETPPDLDIPSVQTARYLQYALHDAETNTAIHPLTLPTLSARYGAILERLGTAYSPKAYESFLRAWNGYSGQGLDAAWIAVRLGDLDSRLHRSEEAQKWWKSAIQLSQGNTEVGALLQPTVVPTSPWAQRIIVSTMVSLSANYAQSGQLSEAETFEEAALGFIRSIPVPESIDAVSPAQALHSLFILQRSSLLSIHLAEVLHARKKSVVSSIQHLTSAAESSERVARGLAGMPLRVDGVWNTEVPRHDSEVSPAYTSSNSMGGAATRLYRDAQRTSAEAWNLLGVLYERKEGPASKLAHMCYERAVQWSGHSDGDNSEGHANDATTDADWKVFWANFQRTKSTPQK